MLHPMPLRNLGSNQFTGALPASLTGLTTLYGLCVSSTAMACRCGDGTDAHMSRAQSTGRWAATNSQGRCRKDGWEA